VATRCKLEKVEPVSIDCLHTQQVVECLDNAVAQGRKLTQNARDMIKTAHEMVQEKNAWCGEEH